MRRRAVLSVALVLLLAAFAPISQARSTGAFVRAFPGSRVTILAGHATQHYRPILARGHETFTGASSPAVVATADIQVTYHGFSATAQAAFQAAVDVWESEIVSSQVIHVDATWTSLGASSGILGAAGPSRFYLGADNRVYPAALEEAICSCEENSGPEIDAEFNSAFADWYLGTDGNVPNDKWDFFSVVLHELGHGLGFLSSFDVSGTQGSWGFTSGGTTYPMVFDENEWSDAAGGSLMTSFANPSSALKTQLTDGSVYLGGSNLEAVLGQRAQLYAPSPWRSGSSNSHLDESAFGAGTINALMTPALNNGEAIHDPGPATLAIFRDIGWTTAGESAPTEPGAPTNVTAVAGNGSADVSWNAPASDGGSAITGYTATSAPDGLTCQTTDTMCTVIGLTNGTPYTFTVAATNDIGTGTASDPSNSVTPTDQPIDTTPPTGGLPTAIVAVPQQVGTTATVRVAWAAASDDSGISAYELQRKKGSGSWVPVTLDSPTATSADVAVKPGTSYRFRLRATDGANNVGSWVTTSAGKLTLLQENASGLAYSGTWQRVALSGASGGYVRYASAAGRSAMLSFAGTSIGFVSTLGPARGIAEIWLDGQFVASVDLYAASQTSRAVVWASPAPLSPGTHTLQVRVTGTRNPSATKNRIDLDAFLVWT
jgi:hypothetical protein